MRIKNKHTGKVVEWERPLQYKLGHMYNSLEEFNKDWEDAPDGKLEEKQRDHFDWEVAKDNLIKTDCGITLCREDYFEGDKHHFTFDEALEIEKEAKKHGFRLPTPIDFTKLYAFYGVEKSGRDTPRRFINELGFTYAGYYKGATLYSVGANGDYWSSSVYGIGGGYRLLFNTMHVYPQDYSSEDNGLAIKFIYEGEE